MQTITVVGDNEFLLLCDSKENEDGGYHWIDFKVYEIPCTDTSGKVFFNKKGYTGSGEYTESTAEAEVFIEGFLKWDGCTEWEFVDASHFCGRHSAHILTRIVDALYDTAVNEFEFTEENVG